MLGALDFSSLLSLLLTAVAVALGSLFLVKKAASKYFVVDAGFDSAEGYGSSSSCFFSPFSPRRLHRMSIGGGDGGGDCAACAACGRAASKKCAGCKSVWYCSLACQSSHWKAVHRLKCKQARASDKVERVPSENAAYRSRKTSGFSSISLVPARGSSNVLQQPKSFLFPYEEFVQLFNCDKYVFPPCGLLNCGNSCFANVVLQCLAFTRPLTVYLLEKEHSRTCIRKQKDWCFLCELQAHVQRASQSRHPFSPINILSRIPNIGGNLGCGSQEDAHEFMRFAIDTMQSVCLDEYGGEKAIDPSTQETTLIQHIFGGHLQSQVKCTRCNMISNRYENMMDLTVEIHGDAGSLEECLNQFTVKEWLDGDNKYKCDGCNSYVKAWKRLTVHQAPNVLTIALKRFQSGRFGKLNKRVTFPEELDLSPYMSEGGDGTELYSLYAVVVHLDMLNASFFGHYICYVKDYYGHWYRIDDCKVTTVDVEEVLAQGAYMLFYSRRTARREPFVKPMEPARKKPLISRDASSSNLPNGDILYSDLSAIPSNNGYPGALCSNNGSESNLSLPRDTGHDRLPDDATDDSKVKEGVEMESPMEVHNHSGDAIFRDSVANSLGQKGCEESSSQPSRVQEAVAASFPANPLSEEAQDMECEESEGCAEERSSKNSDVQINAFAATETVPNILPLETPSFAEGQAMECEQSSGTHDANPSGEQPSLSDHTSDTTNDVGNHMPEPSPASTIPPSAEPERSDESQLKAETVVVEDRPLGITNGYSNTNGYGNLADVSFRNGTRASRQPARDGTIRKPKPLFSRGFLGKPTGERSVDCEKKIQKEKLYPPSSTSANGCANGGPNLNHDVNGAASGLKPERRKGCSSGSDMAFMNRGFLSKAPSKSSPELRNGEANGSIPAEIATGTREAACTSNELKLEGSNGDASKSDMAFINRGFLNKHPSKSLADLRSAGANGNIKAEIAPDNGEAACVSVTAASDCSGGDECSVSEKDVVSRLEEDRGSNDSPGCNSKLMNGMYS